MTETFCDSGAVKLKAGTNVNSNITAAQYTQLINEAESYINAVTRINYTDTYAALNDDTKKLLEDAASCHAATSAVAYDMSGYTSRSEAQTILDVCWARMMEAIKLLKDKDTTSFINNS